MPSLEDKTRAFNLFVNDGDYYWNVATVNDNNPIEEFVETMRDTLSYYFEESPVIGRVADVTDAVTVIAKCNDMARLDDRDGLQTVLNTVQRKRL